MRGIVGHFGLIVSTGSVFPLSGLPGRGGPRVCFPNVFGQATGNWQRCRIWQVRL